MSIGWLLVLLGHNRIGPAVSASRTLPVRIGQINESVLVVLIGAPVVVDAVEYRMFIFQRLVGVSHAAAEDRQLCYYQVRGENLAESRSLPKVDDGDEDRAGDYRNIFIPRLGVEAARDAALLIKRNVILDNLKSLGRPAATSLALWIFFLEPAAFVAGKLRSKIQQARDVGLWQAAIRLTERPLSSQLLIFGFGFGFLRLPPSLVLLIPIDRLLRPSRKSVYLGCQPSSLRILVGIDAIAQIVAGPVLDVLVIVLVFAHQLKNSFHNFFVVLFAVGADHISFADLAFFQNS